MSSDQQLSVPSLTTIQVELFWARHGKKVLIGAALVFLILIGVGAYIGYQAVRNASGNQGLSRRHMISTAGNR